jgi:hypothetical protein
MAKLASGTLTQRGEATEFLKQLFETFYIMYPNFVRRQDKVTKDMETETAKMVKELTGTEMSQSSAYQHLTYGAGAWLTTSKHQLVSYEKYGRFYMDAIAPLERAKELQAKILIKQLSHL